MHAAPATRQRRAARALGRMLIYPIASCRAPRQDCIETSAKCDVMTVCSSQSAGNDTLQSTAMIAIMIGVLVAMDVWADAHRTRGCIVPLLANRIRRRKGI